MNIKEAVLVGKNYIKERFPKHRTYIDRKFQKMELHAERLSDDIDFIFDELSSTLKECKSQTDLSKFDKKMKKLLDYNEYLKKRYIDNYSKFMNKLVVVLERKNNLKDYE